MSTKSDQKSTKFDSVAFVGYTKKWCLSMFTTSVVPIDGEGFVSTLTNTTATTTTSTSNIKSKNSIIVHSVNGLELFFYYDLYSMANHTSTDRWLYPLVIGTIYEHECKKTWFTITHVERTDQNLVSKVRFKTVILPKNDDKHIYQSTEETIMCWDDMTSKHRIFIGCWMI